MSAGRAPLDGVDVVLSDLDGVVYAGESAIPHAVESLVRARSEGRQLGFITNNASRSDAVVAAHLTELGIAVPASAVVTSPQAAMRVLRSVAEPPARILVVGGEGLVVEVERAGYTVTTSADDEPAAVVQGFAPEVGWVHLAEAAFALHRPEEMGGIPWIATNTDVAIPRARGIAPGNGTLVAAVASATGRTPLVAGKPETPIFAEAVARFGATSPLFLGDRLNTDIAGARRAGMRSALVLTGIERPSDVILAGSSERPDFILGDLRELFEPTPAVVIESTRVMVGNARVVLAAGILRVEAEGERPIDLVRAAAAAVGESGLDPRDLGIDERAFADPFPRDA